MDSNELDSKRFLDIKQANGQSIYTLRSQRTVLLKLNRFLDGKLFRQTGEDDIMAFFGMLNGSFSESTIALSKIVVKSFYRHLYGMRRHEYPSQVINLVVNGGNKRKLPIRPEDVITKEDIVELLRWCNIFRDKAMVVVLYESGARLSEFININVSHLKFDSKGAVLVIDGKTGQRRIRLIESVPFLQRWVESHPHKHEPDAPLWCSVRSPFRRASDKVIEHFFKQLRKKSCFPKPTNPHNFRHSRITELAKYLSDAKLKVFAGWTGSSNMAGTYVHLAGADIEDDLLEIAGVKPEDERPRESPLRVKYCSRCNSKNNGVAEFCYLCGRPFNEATSVEETLENQTLAAQVAELKERSEVADGVIDSMWETIDKLKEELNILKPK